MDEEHPFSGFGSRFKYQSFDEMKNITVNRTPKHEKHVSIVNLPKESEVFRKCMVCFIVLNMFVLFDNKYTRK